MDSIIKTLLTFAAGCGLGYLVASRTLSDKYDRRAQEEINAVKDALRKRHESVSESGSESDTQVTKEYEDRVVGLGYSQPTRPDKDPAPYVISPDIFGDHDDYEQITLTYYSDGVLTDDDDRPIADDMIEQTIGKESLQHFGEYDEDTVLVRNERLKVDYEVVKEYISYKDFLSDRPYMA